MTTKQTQSNPQLIDLCYNVQFNMTTPIFSDEMIRVYLTLIIY
ncbi:hypothetical protein EJK51_0160 [Moraxella catarrhalis]|nr:hypothetical protein EJK52_0161 [Moraxella catarrhalis]AZQ91591.1 hypothetical protein EJK51_0160 [Moraxella catarrhalis]SQH69218.1 Uncharacterised protein [Moraxella catarrhalis]